MEPRSCVTFWFILLYILGTAIAQDLLPIVDLGYSIHQATYNVIPGMRESWSVNP